MKISTCTQRPILEPCSLEGFNFQVDPYVGCAHLCYYCYALGQAETDWAEEVQVHSDIVGQLQDELKGLVPQAIYMGYHTDPYQPCEAERLQTRRVLELLLESGFSASILTKSDLVVRDMDILSQMPAASVSISVAFHDNGVRRRFEANTVDTEVRIDALRVVKQAGIHTGALLCPVIPYITDTIPLMAALTGHADTVWIYSLSIPDRHSPSGRNMARILDRFYPDSHRAIEAAVIDKEDAYWVEQRRRLERFQSDAWDLRVHL